MIRTRLNKSLILTLSSAALAVLGACGGGGDTTSTTPTATASAVTLQTYITDNLATEYSKVWVTIKKVTATDSTGAVVTLLDATAAPVVVNLSSLADVGQFMSSVTLPAGIYTQIAVTLGNDVQLVSLDGTTTVTGKLGSGTSDFVWNVRNLSFDTSTTGQLVLDFNLARFTYSAATGLVTPQVDVPTPTDAFRKFVRQQAEVHGTVQSVDTTAGTITVNDSRLGTGVVVSLATDAVITNESTGSTLTLAQLTAGTRIGIKGTVTPGATTADPVTVTATVVHVESAVTRARGEGTVSAVNGTLVTVRLTDANFLPGSDSVVVDIGTATFPHGLASDLAVGVAVSFRGQVSGIGSAAVITATTVDVRGAASRTARQAHPDHAYVGSGVRGTVGTVNSDGTFTFTVGSTTATTAVPAGTYTVNAASATYHDGTATCLVAGATVQVLGTLSGTTLSATVLDIDGCAGQRHSEPHGMR
ncbi:DUF4382 domain-containing protein [Sphaerotilus sp.]|uniref:DUF4382 domain-containing protein n=1 Tax=Sphaerotilus sp. TaxID=2093942 RepID=UPI0034E2E398